MEAVLFTLELLRRIPRNRKVTASQLREQLCAAGFDRDLRTVQRQLEALSEHFGIERDDRSKPYGYRWGPNAKGFCLPMLTEQQSVLLALAEQQLGNLLPTGLMQSMQGFFEQARYNLLPAKGPVHGQDWLSKVRFVSETQPLLPAKVYPGVFAAVSNALYEDRWLQVCYENKNGRRTTGEVMPLGLAQKGPRLYLACRYRDYDDDRTLALHRIVSAKALTLRFDRPPEFDLRKFAAEGEFSFGSYGRIKLRFRVRKGAGAHLLETPLSTDQQVKEVGDELEITATVEDTFELEQWLLGFGEDISEVRRTPTPAVSGCPDPP